MLRWVDRAEQTAWSRATGNHLTSLSFHHFATTYKISHREMLSQFLTFGEIFKFFFAGAHTTSMWTSQAFQTQSQER